MFPSDLQNLVVTFRDSVLAQDLSLAKTDFISGNSHAEAYIAAFERLREHGPEGLVALSQLLTDPNAAVRVMAATFLLGFDQVLAREVLEQEAQGRGLVAFGAQQALARWDSGEWHLWQ